MYRIVKHLWGYEIVRGPVSEYGCLAEHFAERGQAMEWLLERFIGGIV